MILGTPRKTSKWASRAAASAMIIGAAALSAPMIQATDHPEEELAGKPHMFSKNKSKSVIKFSSDDDGEKVSKHYEIEIDGGDVKAFEIDNAGRKTSIDPKEIEGFDIDDVKGAKALSFGLNKKHKLKMMSKGDFAHWVDGGFKDWKEGDFKEWVEKGHAKRLMFLKDEDGETTFEFPHAPKPPFPPGLHSWSSDGNLVIEMDADDIDIEGLVLQSRMQSAESMLEAARAMLEEVETSAQDSRKASKVKRELEKARRALKEAEEALKEK